MATTRLDGFYVTAAIWNNVHSSLNDAGTIYSGAFAGTTVAGSTGSFTTSLAVQSAADNTGLNLNASGTNRPAITLSNSTSGVLSLIQADDNGRLLFYTNGSPTPAITLTASSGSGGLSVGAGSVAVPDECLAVEGGAIYLPDASATDGINLFGPGGASPSNILLYSGARGAGAVTGSYVSIGHNSSGGGAPGVLVLYAKNGTAYALWVDTTGDLRIGTALPEEDGTPADTSGTVVGTQS